MTVTPVRELTRREQDEIDRANRSRRPPVVFLHGMWLLAESWRPWADCFEDAGYAALTPGWPDDPETVEQARTDPDAFARKGIADVAAYHERVVAGLDRTPALVGHALGGLLAQLLAGRGGATASVVIDPVPTRGVLPMPFAALRSALPVLRRPGNRGRAVMLSFRQFRYRFANAISKEEARELYDRYHVAASGAPMFESVLANFSPRTEARADSAAPQRGPMLIVSGHRDHQVPPATTAATYERQRRNPGITEFAELADRGHSLTIDAGWESVARLSLDFVRRFVR
ncbi:alpha/beta hydrolase [Saccharopolyspora cebuensis]|uniref:Alpha/beta fold hydrolase n=1 Tax=Saccharopolyspora cebuensis TaxID=418759 RepID=A0ABV4CG45_9PSEU